MQIIVGLILLIVSAGMVLIARPKQGHSRPRLRAYAQI
jgi:hypothetical protein